MHAGWQRLQSLYGKNAKRHELINRAVRAVFPASEIFAAQQRVLAELHNPRPNRRPEEMHIMRGVRDLLASALESMRGEIRRQYGIEAPVLNAEDAEDAEERGGKPTREPREVVKLDGRDNWTPPASIVERMGKESDQKLADECGVAPQTIANHRQRLGIAPCESSESHRWTPAMDKLLGTKPDGELAKLWQMSDEAVRRRREKLGIEPTRKKSAWTAERRAILTSEPDNAIAAAKLGISIAAVKTARSRAQKS